MEEKSEKKFKDISRLIGADQGKRKDNDYYPTPTWAIDEMISRVKIDGLIWEPACGDGAISKQLIKNNYTVYSTDLYDYGYGKSGIDFLKEQIVYDNIVTNPPFGISTAFAIHGLNLVRNKLILLNKLTFLEGKVRKAKLFSQNKLERVLIFSERINFNPKVMKKTGGMLSFAWFIFDKHFDGAPSIEWI